MLLSKKHISVKTRRIFFYFAVICKWAEQDTLHFFPQKRGTIDSRSAKQFCQKSTIRMNRSRRCDYDMRCEHFRSRNSLAATISRYLIDTTDRPDRLDKDSVLRSLGFNRWKQKKIASNN